MLPAMLLAAKLVVLDRCLDRRSSGFQAPFLPFWSVLEHPDLALIWSRLLGMLFVGGALLLLFNISPRIGAGCAGGALVLDTLAGRLRFSNSALLFDLILIVAALSSPDDRARIVLRAQLFLVYFGAALNKLLHPDWHDGQYFAFWTREILQLNWFTQIDTLAGGRFSVFMGWLTIGIESALACLVLWTRQTRIFLSLGLTFHVGMLVFTGGVISWVFLHTMLLAFLPFWTGPVSPTAQEVASTTPLRALLAWPSASDVRPRLAHAAFAIALVCFR